jgi:NADH-quinone oxidoreductase subunit N
MELLVKPPAAYQFIYLIPEIVLAAWGLLVLIVDFGLLRHRPAPRRRQALGWLALAGCLAVLAYLLWPGLQEGLIGYLAGDLDLAADPDPFLFWGTLAGDALTRAMNGVLIALLTMVVALSMTWDFTEQWGEYFALLFWATAGMMLLVAAEELLLLFLTLETMTLCLYLATAFEKTRRRSVEGGLKYFVYGSVSSALFLFGLSLIYGLTGTTLLEGIRAALAQRGGGPGLAGNLLGVTAVVLVLVGFGFKVAAVPFHQWAPDAYEGAPAPVTAWIAAGSKLASFVAMMKVLVLALGPWASRADNPLSPGWVGVVAVLAAASMTYGNFAALGQRNFKRMLAYSSIAHAGYMLVGVLAASVSYGEGEAAGAAAGSVRVYLVVYGFTTVGAFALAAWLARDAGADDLDDLNGLGHQHPGLAICLVVLMLSLIGMPPLAGFFGKLYMFMEALDTRDATHAVLVALVALALLNSVVSAFYYVRVLKAMFLRPAGRVLAAATPGISWPIVGATVVAVGFGVFPAPLLDSMKGAAIPMLAPGGASQGVAGRYATRPDSAFVRPSPADEAARLEQLRRGLRPDESAPPTPPPPTPVPRPMP